MSGDFDILSRMMGKTHFAIGANAAWIALYFSQGTLDPIWVPGLLIIGGVAGLIPDMDTRKSSINKIANTFYLHKFLRHRSFTHSMLAVVGVGVMAPWMGGVHPIAPTVFFLGYLSHPIIDGLNDMGVEYFFPKDKNYRLLPKVLCVSTGGWVDHLFFGLGSVGMLGFALVALNMINISIKLTV